MLEPCLSQALFAVCAISRKLDRLRGSLRWLVCVLVDRIAQAPRYVHFVTHVQSSGVGQLSRVSSGFTRVYSS